MLKVGRMFWISWNVFAVFMLLIGLAGVPDDLKQWAKWATPILESLDQNVVRWILVLSAIAPVLVVNTPWRRLIPGKRTSNHLQTHPTVETSAVEGQHTEGTTGRRVVEKNRIVNRWCTRVDELVSVGEAASRREDIVKWAQQVKEALEQYLADTARGREIKKGFTEVIDVPARVKKQERVLELRNKGIQYLKDVKYSVKHQDLR